MLTSASLTWRLDGASGDLVMVGKDEAATGGKGLQIGQGSAKADGGSH